MSNKDEYRDSCWLINSLYHLHWFYWKPAQHNRSSPRLRSDIYYWIHFIISNKLWCVRAKTSKTTVWRESWWTSVSIRFCPVFYSDIFLTLFSSINKIYSLTRWNCVSWRTETPPGPHFVHQRLLHVLLTTSHHQRSCFNTSTKRGFKNICHCRSVCILITRYFSVNRKPERNTWSCVRTCRGRRWRRRTGSSAAAL